MSESRKRQEEIDEIEEKIESDLPALMDALKSEAESREG